MWKRLAAYFAAVAALVSALFGCLYYQSWQTARRAAKDLREPLAQKDALDSLGQVELQIVNLTSGKLKELLRQSPLRIPGNRNSSKLGWACGQKDCAIWATFNVPTGQEIPSDMVPGAFVVRDPLFEALFDTRRHVSVDGAYLGEPIELFQESCRRRGFGVKTGTYRMTWDKNWQVIWIEMQGRVGYLCFLNGSLLNGSSSESPNLQE